MLVVSPRNWIGIGIANRHDQDRKASDYVKSEAHGAYAKMLLVVNSIVVWIESYISGCKCHRSSDMKVRGASYAKRSATFTKKYAPGRIACACPLVFACCVPTWSLTFHFL